VIHTIYKSKEIIKEKKKRKRKKNYKKKGKKIELKDTKFCYLPFILAIVGHRLVVAGKYKDKK